MSIVWHEVIYSARQAGRSVLDELGQRGLSRREALEKLSARLGMPLLDTTTLEGARVDFSRISSTQALQWKVLPLRLADNRGALALADPLDQGLEDRLSSFLADGPQRLLAAPETIADFLRRAGHTTSTENATADTAPERDGIKVSQRVQDILVEALEAEASDIHLESTGNGLRVKFRIDGVLVPAGLLEGTTLAEQVISRLKILSELDIAERRVPQDGRFQSRMQERDVDFRVSIMPSLAGEDAVVRILDRHSLTGQSESLTLSTIGFEDNVLHALRRMIHAPYGMVLVTGPTGSGKTTTLYAALNEVNHGEDKIITIEDPVEYQLPDVLQIPVNERKGLTFARGLRSILRHDPDKIMVGEIRDEETAEIAVQAALTGHLVFTTVHANNVFDVIGRFAHMGVDTYNFVSALTGVMAQRLVRVICPHCSSDHQPDAEELEAVGILVAELPAFRFRRGQGCGHCRHTGYKGRRAIAEVLPLNDELRDLIITRVSTRQLRQAAQNNGMQSLRTAALAMVKAGETTIQEANRVTFME